MTPEEPDIAGSLALAEQYVRIEANMRMHLVSGYSMDLYGKDFQSFRSAIVSNRLCAVLSDREVIELAQQAALFRFSEGDEVVNIGELGTHWFAVRDGRYSITTEADGKTHVLLGAGDAFSVLSVAHTCRQEATVRAQEVGTCWGIRRDTFRTTLLNLVERTRDEILDLLDHSKFFQYLSKRKSPFAVRLWFNSTRLAGRWCARASSTE
eukprot:CAMPEP_0180692798 /NCGR_PEP_ID=MMETSP1038_2-20121128/1013_1 /TAXON_ID=632150 /ORGANISM="Azadinium spinosum, Strain 3D9" /LENGTH=208 /DNA_ID=CAMNT_0022723985 /DNA_START=124 /DNA_END=747 /DNA_ORIENTATION=+